MGRFDAFYCIFLGLPDGFERYNLRRLFRNGTGDWAGF